jgi:glutamate dehydrogenase (NAD(P)+)
VVAIYQTLGIDPIAFVAGKARERGLTLEVPPGLAIEHLMNEEFASALSGTGVVHALDRAVAATGDSLAGKRASVQGFGSVGRAAVDALVKHGVAVVAVSDVHGTVYHPDGLDPVFLAHSGNRRSGEIDRDQLPAGCRLLLGDEWLAAPCDVLVPAAIADSITLVNVLAVHPEVQFVVEGANGPISVDAEQLLEDGGVTVLPDFVANAGSAVAFGLLVTGESTLDTVSEDYLNRIAVAVDRCTDRSGTGERYTRGRAMAMAEEYLTALSDDNSY